MLHDGLTVRLGVEVVARRGRTRCLIGLGKHAETLLAYPERVAVYHEGAEGEARSGANLFFGYHVFVPGFVASVSEPRVTDAAVSI